MNAKEMKKELMRIKNDSSLWEDKYSKEDFEDYVSGDIVLKSHIDPEDNYDITFLGTYMYLDPCGRYHHILSPNGVTKKCISFWERLEKACDSLNMWLEEGEGDPCDIFICKQKQN